MLDNKAEPVGHAAIADHLQYVRLRAPRRNGETLDYPPSQNVPALFQRNRQLRDSFQAHSMQSNSAQDNHFAICCWRTKARAEVVAAALDYSRRYLPDSATSTLDAIKPADHATFKRSIVFAGHQPTLFHAGVWYKNFCLNQLATTFGATAINLVVDNDLAGAPSVKIPVLEERHESDLDGPAQRARTRFVKYDSPGPAVAHEMRGIQDDALFDSFGTRLAKQIKPIAGDPLITPLWREVLIAKEKMSNVSAGRLIAAGRHRLEWANGLRGIELPVSHLAATESFAAMASYTIESIEQFQSTYNDVLKRYRTLHGIRSSAHPVPELVKIDEWHETPFWIWTSKSHRRHPLMVRLNLKTVDFSDSRTTLATLPRSEVAAWLHEQASNVLLGRPSFYIRPRALITTMFSRLLASDLFVHGIGGAKYDQVTDQIISQFFGIEAPGYLTATGTWKLPATSIDEVLPSDITRQQDQIRKMRFHPESFLEQPDAVNLQWIAKKMKAISGDGNLPPNARHREIESANRALQKAIVTKQETANERLSVLKSQLRDSQIMHSREYSFCLHERSLVEQLRLAASD